MRGFTLQLHFDLRMPPNDQCGHTEGQMEGCHLAYLDQLTKKQFPRRH